MNFAPADKELVIDEVAEKLGLPRGDILNVRMVDWIVGEVLVQYRHAYGRGLTTVFLEGASEAAS